MLRKSRAIEDPKALQDLMMQAGFRDVKIVCRTRTARLPAVDDFILLGRATKNHRIHATG